MYFQESPKSLLSRFAFAELIRAISRLQNAFAVTVATSVRIGHFPDLPEKADVTTTFSVAARSPSWNSLRRQQKQKDQSIPLGAMCPRRS
jgi:hypothetical protein